MSRLSQHLTLALVATTAALAAGGSVARADLLDHTYFRLGGLDLIPLPRSGPVVLSNIVGPASLAVSNGPIEGSSTGMSSIQFFSATVGYHLSEEFSIETVLGLPPPVKITAKGTLATKSLASTALGTFPTGVPPLGSELGETKILPPVVTITYKLFPFWAIDPYIGMGVSYLYSYDSKITNPILTQYGNPKLDIPGRFGFVLQSGIDVKLWRKLHFTADFKYIAGLKITAHMSGVVVAVPALPIYGKSSVGDATTTATINPIILSGGIGWDF